MTQNKPYIVGLTGGIATGKSHLADTLRKHGVVVIDADAISHQLTAPGGRGLAPIRRVFGETVFAGEQLNRKALGQLVFGEPQQLAKLNAILHPLIFDELSRQIAKHHHQKALVVEVPLLYETGYNAFCDQVWCAYAPEDVQIERLLERGLNKQEALQRIASQIPAVEQAKRSDQVIHTDGDKEQSARVVLSLWQELESRLRHEQ